MGTLIKIPLFIILFLFLSLTYAKCPSNEILQTFNGKQYCAPNNLRVCRLVQCSEGHICASIKNKGICVPMSCNSLSSTTATTLASTASTIATTTATTTGRPTGGSTGASTVASTVASTASTIATTTATTTGRPTGSSTVASTVASTASTIATTATTTVRPTTGASTASTATSQPTSTTASTVASTTATTTGPASTITQTTTASTVATTTSRPTTGQSTSTTASTVASTTATTTGPASTMTQTTTASTVATTTSRPTTGPATTAPSTIRPTTGPATTGPATTAPSTMRPTTGPATTAPATTAPVTTAPSTMRPTTGPATTAPATTAPATTSPATTGPTVPIFLRFFEDLNGDGILQANEPGISVTCDLRSANGEMITRVTTPLRTSNDFPGSRVDVHAGNYCWNCTIPAGYAITMKAPGETSNNFNPDGTDCFNAFTGQILNIFGSIKSNTPATTGTTGPATTTPATTAPATTAPATTGPATTAPATTSLSTTGATTAPATTAPATTAPATTAPATTAPATTAPATTAPATTAGPATTAPATTAPATTAPATTGPATTAPATTAPATTGPATTAPATTAPATTAPATTGPATTAPATTAPATTAPATTGPATTAPATTAPATTGPAIPSNTQAFSIKGYSWWDSNDNGVDNSGEPYLGGMQGTLTDATGNTVSTFTTDSSKRSNGFQIDNVTPGDYCMTIIDPSGKYVSGTVGTDSKFVNDKYCFTVGPSTADASNNIIIKDGMIPAPNNTIPTYTLTGYAWWDRNSDGGDQSGEPYLSNITGVLTDVNGNIVNTFTTDAAGRTNGFTVANLQPGYYCLNMTDSSGKYITSPVGTNNKFVNNQYCFDLGPTTTDSSNTLSLAAGFVPLPTYPIKGYAFYDVDNDGEDDFGEPNLNGITVNIIDANGVVVQTMDTDSTKGPNGFQADLLPGHYCLNMTDPKGNYVNGPLGLDNKFVNNQYCFDVTPNNTVPTIRFGMVPTKLYKFNVRSIFDRNENGMDNSGEPYMGNMTYTLSSPGQIAGRPPLATNIGDRMNTSVEFGVGNYCIKVTGVNDDIKNSIVADNKFVDYQYCFQLDDSSTTNGVFSTDAYFTGNPLQTIQVYAWNDNNADGLDVAGEPYIAGVQVIASNVDYGFNIDYPNASKTTVNPGNIQIPNAVFGNTCLAITLPAGKKFGPVGTTNKVSSSPYCFDFNTANQTIAIGLVDA